MNILYIGAGFVGACSAGVSANSGHTTLVYDVDKKRIEKLGSADRDTIESCLFEEGLGDLLVRNRQRIAFTTDYGNVEKFLDQCDAVFLCLPTPEIGETGESDLQYYEAAVKELAGALTKRTSGAQENYIVIVNKSTVPIGTVDRTHDMLAVVGAKNFGVVSNPEFLVEGRAIQGSLKPDRIVIGAWDEKDFAVMRRVYQRFYDAPSVEYIEVNPKEAAAGKLLANFYLFNKLAVCFDVIGRTAEAFDNVQFENLRRIIMTDVRIGSWGFYDSLFAGGSCFIKDARSLAHQLRTAGHDTVLVDETYVANQRQLELFMGRAESEARFVWKGKTVTLLGTAFKRDTNDVRNAASIGVMGIFQEKGVATVRVYDPAALPMFQTLFPASGSVVYTDSEQNALTGADAVVITADWPQFRGVADMLLAQKSRPLIMDGRRMLQHRYAELRAAGFDIVAVGSPFMRGSK